MEKKGFLLGEFTLKIIIAVFSILILIYLLFSIYKNFSDDSATANAKATIEKIYQNINLVYNSKEVDKSVHYIIQGPKSWYLVYFGKGSLKPDVCGREPCLCICKKDNVEKCDESGACRILNPDKVDEVKGTILSSSIAIVPPTEIIIKMEKEGILITKKPDAAEEKKLNDLLKEPIRRRGEI